MPRKDITRDIHAIINSPFYSLSTLNKEELIKQAIQLSSKKRVSRSKNKTILRLYEHHRIKFRELLNRLKVKKINKRKEIAKKINQENEKEEQIIAASFSKHLEYLEQQQKQDEYKKRAEDRYNISHMYYPIYKEYLNEQLILSFTVVNLLHNISESYRYELELHINKFKNDPTTTALKTLPIGLQLLLCDQAYDLDGRHHTSSSAVLMHSPGVYSLFQKLVTEISAVAIQCRPELSHLTTGEDVSEKVGSNLAAMWLLTLSDPEHVGEPNASEEMQVCASNLKNHLTQNNDYISAFVKTIEIARKFNSLAQEDQHSTSYDHDLAENSKVKTRARVRI